MTTDQILLLDDVSRVLLVPLLAAGLAWVAVRRHPKLTRRLA